MGLAGGLTTQNFLPTLIRSWSQIPLHLANDMDVDQDRGIIHLHRFERMFT